MKFKNILILEQTGCDTAKCEGSWTTITAAQYDTYKNDPTLQACFEPTNSYKYCKLKKKQDPPVDNSKPCVQPTECPPNVEDFLKWYWKDKGWVDASGNPDTKSHQDEINGVELDKKNCVIRPYKRTYEEAKTRYTGQHKCIEGAEGTSGLKIAYSKSKVRYTPTQNIVTVDPDLKAKEECAAKGGTYNPQTKNCDMPLNPEVQDFRIDFDTKFGSLVDKFTLKQKQWNRMGGSMPETYPPTSFSVFQDITTKIVDYISKYYRSKEFGLFVNILDAFVDLYGDKKDDEGKVIEDKSKILDRSFFKRFGGTIEQVKALSDSIKNKNNETELYKNFDSLSNPETELRYFFQEVIVTVLEEPQSYFTEPLQMKAFRYTKSEPIVNIDLSPIKEVLSGSVNSQNCLKVLDVHGEYSSNPQVPENLIVGIRNMGQKCLCANFYKDLGKLSIKDKFNKEKRNLARRRLASVNSMGIYMSKC